MEIKKYESVLKGRPTTYWFSNNDHLHIYLECHIRCLEGEYFAHTTNNAKIITNKVFDCLAQAIVWGRQQIGISE